MDPEAQIQRLRDKVRRLEKRLEHYLDAAAQGTLNPERLQSAAIGIATETLDLEDRLLDANRQAQQRATEDERRLAVEQVLAGLREGWNSLEFSQKQGSLRESLEKIIVKDDELELVVRS